MSPPFRDSRRVRAITVASWFPAVDDTTKGRFVADQIEALRSTGAVDPLVISFEPALLTGGSVDRQRQASAVRHVAERAVRTHPAVFATSGWSGPAAIPVARLPIPSGNRAMGTPTHPADDRRAALEWLVGRLESPQPTIIHAHTGYPDGSAASTLTGPLAAPLVITEHATFVGQQLAQPDVRRAYADGVRLASRLIAVSQSLADELRLALPEYAAKIIVIPNAVPMDGFRAAALDDRRPDELLYVGYRTEVKGIDVLLAAFARVRSVRTTATLRLIGRSPTEEIEGGWRRLAAELGVSDAVTFEGPRLRPGVATAMAEASLLVHASRRETFGVAPVEALASGLPVVAADTGPLREILGMDPGPLGALAPVGDSEALAAAIIATLERRTSFDPERLRGAVEGRFGSAAVARQIVELYGEVLEEQGCPTAGPSTLTGPAHSLDGSAQRRSRRVLVVGFHTAKVATLLAAMPAECRRDVVLVCSAGDGQPALPSDLADVVAVDTSSVARGAADRVRAIGPRGNLLARLRRFLRDPRAAVLHRRLRGQRDRLYADAVRRAVDRLEWASGMGGAPDIVCVDGLDYLAAERTVAAGRASAVPGGIRWLADHWLVQESVSADTAGPDASILVGSVGGSNR